MNRDFSRTSPEQDDPPVSVPADRPYGRLRVAWLRLLGLMLARQLV
jgi:hypothetical protein